jgi:hypothetical protein
LSHLFNSIVVALFDTCVIQFTWAIPNSIHAYVKHKGSSANIFSSPLFSNHLTFPTKLSIYTLQCTSLLPYLSYHSILIILKCWTKLFSNVCLVWLCLDCMVCLWCVIIYTESYVFYWEKWKIVDFKKASDTHFSTYFLLLHYCFSVVCMIGWFSKKFMKCLDSSSV